MTVMLRILRSPRGGGAPFWQTFRYALESEGDTVATALCALNGRSHLTDADGRPAEAIEWECSCLQKKCGACAMVINGRPRLACEAKLTSLGEGPIRVEPLRKFPVICDLVVDRSILFENLKTLRLWLESDAALDDRDQALAYEASECLQCGCCLEICPNFYPGGAFYGMATVPLTTRLLTEMDASVCRSLAKQYVKHTFEGCGRSLACKDVCPRNIDTEKLMVNANALALWKRKRRKTR